MARISIMTSTAGLSCGLGIAEHSDRPIDVLNVLKMVLIHDIVEIDAGDTFIYDTTKSHTNTAEELVAAKGIFGLLPIEQAEEFIAIWDYSAKLLQESVDKGTLLKHND